MFKVILSTVFIRILLAGLNFFLAILTTQYLGPEGKGDVSLFVLNLTIIQLVNNFVGGPYLTYLVPRKNIMHLLILSYTWAVVSAISVSFVLMNFNLLRGENVFDLVLISILFSFFSINTVIMMGKEDIGKYNATSVVQAGGLILCFIFYLEYFGVRNVSSYINAMYFSVVITFFVSFVFIVKYFDQISLENIYKTFLETLKKGFVLQVGAFAQLFNYRLSYYIIDNLHEGGRKEVGIYSVAVAVAEAMWLISHSVSIVLYSRISNSNDIVNARRLSVALVKIVFICTILCTLLLLLMPSSIFAFVFGNGFGDVKSVMFPLSAGIIIFSAGVVFSAYFVGIGKPQVSVIGSVLGLVATVLAGFALIPRYGMMGAGITASISYTVSVSYQFVKFMQEAKEVHLRDFIFRRNDLKFIFLEFKSNFYISKSK